MLLLRSILVKKNKLLGIDLDKLLKETIDGIFEAIDPDSTRSELEEKLKQEKMAKAVSKSKQRAKRNPDETAGDEAIEPTAERPTKIKHEKVPDINPKTIKDKIDSLRSGKSLKDKETFDALKAYFEKLNGPERIALFAFLSGLDKILGQQNKEVNAPHQDPYNIDMEEDKEVSTGKSPGAKPKGTKDIARNKKAETPIVVGESQDKRNILKVINSKRRI